MEGNGGNEMEKGNVLKKALVKVKQEKRKDAEMEKDVKRWVREDKTNINREDKSQSWEDSRRWVKIERSKRPMRRRKGKNSRRKP